MSHGKGQLNDEAIIAKLRTGGRLLGEPETNGLRSALAVTRRFPVRSVFMSRRYVGWMLPVGIAIALVAVWSKTPVLPQISLNEVMAMEESIAADAGLDSADEAFVSTSREEENIINTLDETIEYE